jgi:hypothetical protein
MDTVKKLPAFFFFMERSDWGKLIESLKKRGILKTEKIINTLTNVPRTVFCPKTSKNTQALMLLCNRFWGKQSPRLIWLP